VHFKDGHMMITIKQTLLIYTIIVASLVYSITSPLSAEAKKKSDDTLSPKEQSKLTDTQKEDSTVDFNNGDNKCDESHENCGDAKGSCGPGFKLRKGNCVKDVFINVHKKSSGGNNDGGYNGDSPAMKLTSNLPKGCVLVSQNTVPNSSVPSFVITVKCNA
jgi:hypothetical protein